MAMNGFTKDMNIIQKLNDEPNDRDGLTAGELKAKFDEGGLAVKDYLNNTVKPHVDGMEETADAHAADAVKHITAEERANWNNKVDKVSGKGLSTNDYTTAEKEKLAGIEAQANKYTHPAYTARTGKPTANLTPGFGDTVTVSQITSDATGHVTGATDRTIKIPATTASTSAAGLMSAADKTKLNGIAAGAQVNSITGVKGNAEGSYRTGNVNLTPANLGAAPASHTHTSDAVTDLVTATKYGPTGLVSFNGKEGLPLKSWLVGIKPAQEGSGDPSPSNIRPISGWTGAKVCQSGKNILSFTKYNIIKREYGITFDVVTNENGDLVKIVANGTDTSTGPCYSQVYIQVPASYARHFSGKILTGGAANLNIQLENAYSPYTVFAKDSGSGATISSGITGARMVNIICRVPRGATVSNLEIFPMIREAGTDATYEPCQGKFIDYTFPTEAGTVYGGTLDVLKGTLTVTHLMREVTGATSIGKENPAAWNNKNVYYITNSDSDKAWFDTGTGKGDAVCNQAVMVSRSELQNTSRTDVFGFATQGKYAEWSSVVDNIADERARLAENPMVFVWRLNVPRTYQLTPELVAALAGQNNFWCDAGDVTVEYGAFLAAAEGAAENHDADAVRHITAAERTAWNGKAAGSHTHAASAINSGILSVARGGTGNSTGYVTAGQKSGTTLGDCATAEGWHTEASGVSAHSEGQETIASGKASHAEGYITRAISDYSHAEGYGTRTSQVAQHVCGKYNSQFEGVEIVGNGKVAAFSNARTLDWNGNEWIAGTLTQASDARLKDVQGDVPDVSDIRAVRFKWNDKKGEHDDRDHIGYLAQEVEKIAPYLVGEDSNGYKSLDYIALLCAKVEMLERRVAELEGGD